MKKLLLVAAVALAWMLGTGAQAQAGGDKCHIHAFFINFCDSMYSICPCEPYCCAGPGCCAPWYTQWPQGAYSQVPTPMQYPYWASPMTPPSAYGHAPHGYGGLQPTGYAVPSYWYKH